MLIAAQVTIDKITDNLTKEMWYIFIDMTEMLLSHKRNEIMTFSTQCMHVEIISLSDKQATPKKKKNHISSICDI